MRRSSHERYLLQIKEDWAISTYRRAVSKTVSHMTRVAWAQKHGEIEKPVPGIQRKSFIYSMSRRQYRRDFAGNYIGSNFSPHFLGFPLKTAPKIGPSKAFSFKDFDTGAPTRIGEYELADETYAKLLDNLAGRKFKGLDAPLKADLLRFYASAGPDTVPKKEKKHWEKTQKDLDQLRSFTAQDEMPPPATTPPHPTASSS